MRGTERLMIDLIKAEVNTGESTLYSSFFCKIFVSERHPPGGDECLRVVEVRPTALLLVQTLDPVRSRGVLQHHAQQRSSHQSLDSRRR